MSTVLFIGAHQDDETLSMGGGIINHKNAGHQVWYGSVTDGRMSGVRTQLGMTYEQFINARDNETALGLGRMNVSFLNFGTSRLVDGSTNPNNYLGNAVSNTKVNPAVVSIVMDMIDEVANITGVQPSQVRVKTHSHQDYHPDHRAVCQAVLWLYSIGYISDVRHYLSPYQWDGSFQGYPSAQSLNCSIENAPNQTQYINALREYVKTNTRINNQEYGFAPYGIGYLSVSSIFDLVRQRLYSKYHIPPTLDFSTAPVPWCYKPLDYELYHPERYEGKRVQVSLGNTTMHTGPNFGSETLMSSGINEAFVDSGIIQWQDINQRFQLYIGGHVSQGMIEGWVPLQDTIVAREIDVKATARVALSVWDTPTGNTIATSDIPDGAELLPADTLNTFDGAFAYVLRCDGRLYIIRFN